MSAATAGLRKIYLPGRRPYYLKSFLSFTAHFEYNRDTATWWARIQECATGKISMMFTDFETLGGLRDTVDIWVSKRADAACSTMVLL